MICDICGLEPCANPNLCQECRKADGAAPIDFRYAGDGAHEQAADSTRDEENRNDYSKDEQQGDADRGEAPGVKTPPVLRSYFAEDLEQQPVEPVDWIVKDFIPSGAVTGFFGDGCTGKDKILFQLAAARAFKRSWLDLEAKPGKSLYIPVEDDDKELNRRREAIAAYYGLRFADFPRSLKIVPLAGKDTVLAAFDGKTGVVKPTLLFDSMRATIEDFRPSLVIVGNRVNIFAVNQNDDAQARQCVNLLSGLALDYQTAVVMPGHVSFGGMNSGSGTSGSVQWSNACRSRIYLSRVTDDERDGSHEPDPEARMLEVKKANWGPTNKKVALHWSRGVYVPTEPATGATWEFCACWTLSSST